MVEKLGGVPKHLKMLRHKNVWLQSQFQRLFHAHNIFMLNICFKLLAQMEMHAVSFIFFYFPFLTTAEFVIKTKKKKKKKKETLLFYKKKS